MIDRLIDLRSIFHVTTQQLAISLHQPGLRVQAISRINSAGPVKNHSRREHIHTHSVNHPEPSLFRARFFWSELTIQSLRPSLVRPFVNLKIFIYHWIPCKLKLSRKTIYLEKKLFLDVKGGCSTQVWLYLYFCFIHSQSYPSSLCRDIKLLKLLYKMHHGI